MVIWSVFRACDERTWPLPGLRIVVKVRSQGMPEGFCLYAWRVADSFVPALYPKKRIRRKDILAWRYAPTRQFGCEPINE